MRGWPVWLLLAVLSRSATADDVAPTDVKAQAKAHADAATQLFNVQQYDKAAEAYQQAYLLDPLPAYLYATGQAQRLAGNCTKALLSYKAYLRTGPSDASKAEKNIERCEQELKDHPPVFEPVGPTTTPVVTPVVTTTPQPATTVTASTADDRSWTKDWVGHALVGGGVGVAVTGLVLYLGGRATVNDHNAATTYEEFAATEGDVDKARTRMTIGVSAIAVGGGLIAGGVLHYILHSRPATDSRTAVVPTTGGASVVFTRSF